MYFLIFKSGFFNFAIIHYLRKILSDNMFLLMSVDNRAMDIFINKV